MEHPDRTFPGTQRMKSEAQIARLFEKGRGGFVYPVRYVFLREEEGGDKADDGVSVLVSVPKRHHKRAVARNLLKRRLREAYRLNREPLSDASGRLSLGLLYASAEVADYRAIEQAVRKIVGLLSDGRR